MIERGRISDPPPHRVRQIGDERLVRLARDGSEAAFSEIVRRHQGPLRSYCAQYVGAAQADDAVQLTFMRAFAALRREPSREIALLPWLYRIARNCSIDLLRKGDAEHEQLDPEYDGVRQPPQIVEQREEIAILVSALRALPEKQRVALTLREFEGRGYGEIAAQLGYTDSAVRQLIFRARTALRSGGAMALAPLGPLRTRLMGEGTAAADPQGVVVAAGFAGVNGAFDLRTAGAVLTATLAVIGGGTATGTHDVARRAASKAANPTSILGSDPSPAAWPLRALPIEVIAVSPDGDTSSGDPTAIGRSVDDDASDEGDRAAAGAEPGSVSPPAVAPPEPATPPNLTPPAGIGGEQTLPWPGAPVAVTGPASGPLVATQPAPRGSTSPRMSINRGGRWPAGNSKAEEPRWWPRQTARSARPPGAIGRPEGMAGPAAGPTRPAGYPKPAVRPTIGPPWGGRAKRRGGGPRHRPTVVAINARPASSG